MPDTPAGSDTTYGQPGGPLMRFIWRSGPAHLPLNTAAGLASVLLISAPLLTKALPLGPLYFLGLLIELLWVAIGAWWCVCSLTTWVRTEPVENGEWRRLKWWIAPVLAIVLFDSHGSRVVQFWVARPNLESQLTAMVARVGPRALAEPAHFRYEIGHPLDNNGFAYSPTPPPTGYSFQYEHIVGPWYFYFGG